MISFHHEKKNRTAWLIFVQGSSLFHPGVDSRFEADCDFGFALFAFIRIIWNEAASKS